MSQKLSRRERHAARKRALTLQDLATVEFREEVSVLEIPTHQPKTEDQAEQITDEPAQDGADNQWPKPGEVAHPILDSYRHLAVELRKRHGWTTDELTTVTQILAIEQAQYHARLLETLINQVHALQQGFQQLFGPRHPVPDTETDEEAPPA